MLASGNGYGDGWWKATGGAAPIDDLANGAGVHGVALERLDECLLELGGADRIQDLDQTLRGIANVLVALGNDPQEGCAASGSARKPVESTLLAGLPLLFDEALEVLGLLDLVTAVPASRVRCDDDVALDDAELVQVGEDDECALGPIMRNRVVVEIEAHVRGLADFDLEPLVSWKPIVWKWPQMAELVVESLADSTRAILDPGTLEHGGGRPLRGLSIEVGKVGVAAGSEERIPHVADGALDAALSLPRATATGRGSKR